MWIFKPMGLHLYFVELGISLLTRCGTTQKEKQAAKQCHKEKAAMKVSHIVVGEEIPRWSSI